MDIRLALLAAAVALVPASAAAAASADAYPAKPIRMIVPFAAGGASDTLARLVGRKLTDAWGQPVIVENRGGAAGSVGTAVAARSPGDGYTLSLGTSGTHGINRVLFRQLAYDPLADFAPLTRLASVQFVLVGHPSLPAADVAGLLRLARAKPGALTFGSGGSPSQLAGELFKSLAGVDLLHVPYKGAAAALTDVVAGQVALTFGGMSIAIPQMKAGRVRAYGVTGTQRSPVLPQVPTIAEAGVPGYEALVWYGLFAPAGTPGAIVDKLNREVVRVLAEAEVRAWMAAQAFDPRPDTPQAFAALIRNELDKWARVAREAGLKPR